MTYFGFCFSRSRHSASEEKHPVLGGVEGPFDAFLDAVATSEDFFSLLTDCEIQLGNSIVISFELFDDMFSLLGVDPRRSFIITQDTVL